MSWWSKRASLSQSDDSLAAEVEWFLNGQYLETVFTSAAEVPYWAWLSVIAHGDSELLTRSEHWLRTHHGLRPELDNWGRVLQHVAGSCCEPLRRSAAQ